MAIVDYAHTPDALINVLAAIKKLRKGIEQVITVVGCGGDRDKNKRPLMAAVAREHSDKAIFTSDNPRTEDPAQIIRDMEEGLAPPIKESISQSWTERKPLKRQSVWPNRMISFSLQARAMRNTREIKG